MASDGYWASIMRRRVKRRTGLTASALGAASLSLSLAGCGSGRSDLLDLGSDLDSGSCLGSDRRSGPDWDPDFVDLPL